MSIYITNENINVRVDLLAICNGFDSIVLSFSGGNKMYIFLNELSYQYQTMT